MRKKLAMIVAVATVIALAAPASSIAVMSPSNQKFEIVGDSWGPKLSTSLGSCSFAKITGQIPATESAASAFFEIPPPVQGSCTGGASMTLGSGKWTFRGIGYQAQMFFSGEIALRFASLPGCKLFRREWIGVAIWSNGLYSSTSPFKSGYHADSESTFNWYDDGGTCALKGKVEQVRYEDRDNGPIGQSVPVTDVLDPKTPIIVR